MFCSCKKFVAILMLLWLPFINGSAFAASVSMQLPQTISHYAVEQTMSHEKMGEHHMHLGTMLDTTDEHGSSCSTCGVCHLACTGYMAVPGVTMDTVQTASRETIPYLVEFHSFSTVPLLPPPLVRV
jgi:hypothetical protein